jgi:hypothetical protein
VAWNGAKIRSVWDQRGVVCLGFHLRLRVRGTRDIWCAREAGVNAGESPAGAIRRFSTEDRANCVAARRGGEQAWSRTGRSQYI